MRGLYTAAAGMLAQMQRQQILTNNLANVNTPGYKADQTSLRSFPNELLRQLGGTQGNGVNIGPISTGVYVQEGAVNFEPGALNETGNNTDAALIPIQIPTDGETGQQGALFFTVRRPNGDIRYTRDGHFSLDALGRLTTADGDLVLDTAGRPVILNGDDFQLDADGRIFENNVPVTRLGIGFAADPNQMVKEENGLFRFGPNGGVLPQASANPNISYQVKQGYLEQSNVSMQEAMTNLMMAYRTFEANQRVLKTYDHSLDLAANQIGRIG